MPEQAAVHPLADELRDGLAKASHHVIQGQQRIFAGTPRLLPLGQMKALCFWVVLVPWGHLRSWCGLAT